ncbi:MAG: hypothetical protein A4S12_00100 [Proteobacteria bacterium SG_bin5]|nr:MAG: hypothetical protein A4S12_00100 [Proteobacteria bacterium SG_bin5]
MAVLVALALSGGFAVLATMTVASRLIVYAVCVAALPRLDRRWGNWVLAVLGALVCAALVAMSEPESWRAVGVAAVIGVALQALARRAQRDFEAGDSAWPKSALGRGGFVEQRRLEPPLVARDIARRQFEPDFERDLVLAAQRFDVAQRADAVALELGGERRGHAA